MTHKTEKDVLVLRLELQDQCAAITSKVRRYNNPKDSHETWLDLKHVEKLLNDVVDYVDGEKV